MHDWCFPQPMIINQPTSFGLVSMIRTIFLRCFFHSDLGPSGQVGRVEQRHKTKKKQLPAVSSDWRCCTQGNNKRAHVVQRPVV